MKPDLSLQRHRLILVSLAFLFVATFLSLRLLQKQVFEHRTYAALAANQQYEQVELGGKRGQILVKDGPAGKQTYPLATNQTMYALNLVPSQISDKRGTAEKLAGLTQLGTDHIYEQINNSKQYIPPVKRKMPYEEAKKIGELRLSGTFILPEQNRFYPEDGLAAQVLGFVNNEGAGQYGAESYYDDILAGKSGSKSGAQSASGEAVALGGSSYVPPKDGDTVVLTIDRNVQFQAEQVLSGAITRHSATGGSLIVMDPKTGAIVAMASQPTFDPNRFGSYSAEDYANQALTGAYEPGSTFKTIAMASALDAGAVTPNTVFNGTKSVTVDNREIFNSSKTAYGRETMTQVIERSDNVGMVYVAQQLGGQRLYDYLKKFGFGTPTGVELDGEVNPGLPPIDELGDVNFATMAFGQGISVTPIQLLTGINVLANGGQLVQPHVLDQIQRRDGTVENVEPKVVRQVISPQAASQITGMMVRVTEVGAGKPAAVPGYRVAGKTGTAQIARAGGGGYEEGANIGNFVGYAPASDPRFVMMVRVDRPKGVVFAEESAAPAFGEMAKFLLKYYNVAPS